VIVHNWAPAADAGGDAAGGDSDDSDDEFTRAVSALLMDDEFGRTVSSLLPKAATGWSTEDVDAPGLGLGLDTRGDEGDADSFRLDGDDGNDSEFAAEAAGFAPFTFSSEAASDAGSEGETGAGAGCVGPTNETPVVRVSSAAADAGAAHLGGTMAASQFDGFDDPAMEWEQLENGLVTTSAAQSKAPGVVGRRI